MTIFDSATVPPDESRPVRRPRHDQRRVVFLLALVFSFLVGSGVGVLMFYASEASSAQITAEPILSLGGEPFIPPVDGDQSNVASPPNTGRTGPGHSLGLYGGTLDNSRCDPQAMVAFLQANVDKAAAWASVQGITPADIPAYVASLTPIILRSDTAVTNHGFSNGAATTIGSVLQAGTAVLVDRLGVPRTLCYCGNPLTPADIIKIETFLNNCKKDVGDAVKWTPAQVDYPEHLSLDMGQSAAYVVGVDIREIPLSAASVVAAGTPRNEPIYVKCVLGARLVPVGQSLDVDNKDWILREFTPSGLLNWSWSVTALAPYDHELRLELQPAVELPPGATNQVRYIFPQVDNSRNIGTFITHVHVKASWIQRAGQWWEGNWKIILGVGAVIGATLISIIKWGGDLGQTVHDASAKWRGKQKQDRWPEE